MADITLRRVERYGLPWLWNRTVDTVYRGSGTTWRNTVTGQLAGASIALQLEGLEWLAAQKAPGPDLPFGVRVGPGEEDRLVLEPERRRGNAVPSVPLDETPQDRSE